MMEKKRKKQANGGGRKLYLKPKIGKGASADWADRKIKRPVAGQTRSWSSLMRKVGQNIARAGGTQVTWCLRIVDGQSQVSLVALASVAALISWYYDSRSGQDSTGLFQIYASEIDMRTDLDRLSWMVSYLNFLHWKLPLLCYAMNESVFQVPDAP